MDLEQTLSSGQLINIFIDLVAQLVQNYRHEGANSISHAFSMPNFMTVGDTPAFI